MVRHNRYGKKSGLYYGILVDFEEGKPWGRENDVLAFAVGQVMPSDDYKKANEGFQVKTEGHIEAYYKIHVNDHLSISPDVQYIWNPYGKDIAENTSGIFVGGMRAQVDF